jgi:hypothetical protein
MMLRTINAIVVAVALPIFRSGRHVVRMALDTASVLGFRLRLMFGRCSFVMMRDLARAAELIVPFYFSNAEALFSSLLSIAARDVHSGKFE